MARYLIKRPHPAKTPIKAGQIVENPQWKNIDYLISRGYVELVEEAPLGSGKLAKAKAATPKTETADSMPVEGND